MSLDLETLDITLVQTAAFFPRYAESGHLVFGQRSSLFAARFDPQTLEVGTPVTVVSDVVVGNELLSDFDISETGSLVYLSGTSAFERVLMRIDRTGASSSLAVGARFYSVGMSFDPTGQRLAVTVYDDQWDIHLYDLDRGTLDPFTSSPSSTDFNPLWSPDGSTIVFASTRSGHFDLWGAPADRHEPPRLLLANEYSKWPLSWSPDGKLLAFGLDHPETGNDVWIYSMDDSTAAPFMTEPYDEWGASFSPDGRWMAYSSKESGHSEVYVRPYASSGRGCRISKAGGREPQWSSDATQLFILGTPPREATGGPDESAVSLTTVFAFEIVDGSFCNSEPTALFDGVEDARWAVSPNADFFVTLEPPRETRLVLIQNFFEELKAKVGN
jgi:dipeptidyl aminopeptidase/acylaminoacyl peptidase